MPNKGKYSFLEAKTKLEGLCAYQERCSYELEQRMNKWGLDEEDQGRLLAHLIEYNFLNEERFAEAFVSGKVKIKRWGRAKIRQSLKLKRISDYSIKKAINAIDEDLYLENMRKLSIRKIESLRKKSFTYNDKAKVYRYLASKGYETELIKDIVDDLITSSEL